MRPTSATGTRETGSDPGFTLIEILVVVAIVGVIVAVVAPNLFEGNAEAARRESGVVALAIERSRDDAWFGGRPTAVSFNDGRLREWRWTAGRWENDGAREQSLGAARLVGLFVDGEALKTDERLVFLPDGLGVPFRVALDVNGMPWAVDGDAAGTVTLVQR